ncbi:beta-1,6-N-acetylglucosaminyltransferase [Pedobacter jamesrossensis]|uniref:Peptide O-xylosyltransferase n=2 Tax=Pedobacter jamesrossensis TaxID=1908238 RepID=A0ABV8NLV9_9SPHI
MRIAHIVMTHKNPAQLARLIKSLQHKDFDFYIHLDKKISIDDFLFLEKMDQVFFIRNRIKCNWGGWNFTQGIINCINEIISLNKNYNFINLLSAQDYPISSVTEIHNYLSERPSQNFINFAPDNSDWWAAAPERYEKYHLTDVNISGKYFFQRMINKILPKRKFPENLKLYGGSDSSWWTLSGDCAQHVAEMVTKNKKLNNFLKYCWGTDEFIIATLVMNSDFKNKTNNNNLRYIDWSEGNAHPKMLKIEDYSNLKSSTMHFARKFDTEIDEVILDKIDKELIS